MGRCLVEVLLAIWLLTTALEGAMRVMVNSHAAMAGAHQRMDQALQKINGQVCDECGRSQ